MVFRSTKTRAKNDLIPNPGDPKFYCCSCDYTYSSKYSYRHHLQHKNKIKLTPIFRKGYKAKNRDILPEWNNQKNYCRSCEPTFASKNSYRRHCIHVHRMKPLPKINFPYRKDTNFYCRICKITFKSSIPYLNHCRYLHPTKSKPVIANPDVLPYALNPNNYCKPCDETFTFKSGFRSHLLYVHKMLSTPNFKKKLKVIALDINDPNHYCCSCDKTYSNKFAFKYHLISIHSIGNQIPEKGSLEPDVDNPNFYCRIYKRTYADKLNYCRHLCRIHRMKLKSLRNCQYDPDFFPDPLDLNFYCSVC